MVYLNKITLLGPILKRLNFWLDLLTSPEEDIGDPNFDALFTLCKEEMMDSFGLLAQCKGVDLSRYDLGKFDIFFIQEKVQEDFDTEKLSRWNPDTKDNTA